MKANSIIVLAGVAALGVGVLWYSVTGALWQFLPIGAALAVGYIIHKLLKEK